MKLIPSLLAGAMLLGLTGAAMAGTATTTFPVSATVVPACSVSGANLQFPNVGNISAASGFTGAQAQTTVSLACNVIGGLPAVVELSAGPMTNQTDGTTVLTYGLFQDSSLTTPWGTTAQSESMSVAGTYGLSNLTVYANIPAQNNVIAGNYASTVSITATY